jgi:oligopeptide transport system ATP-binding protein
VPPAEPLLKVESLVKRYPARAGSPHAAGVTALDGVSFSITPGATLALAGESGSGKSTLALCVACLERPTSGKIWLEGEEVTALNERELRAIRPRIQLIFQDPASAMNPRWTALQIVAEPLVVQNQLHRSEQFDHAQALIERVGLPASSAGRPLAEFSGGQRQRLAIARALAAQPKLLVLDEALSALDSSVQAQIANLLLDLQSSAHLTCLFITHDFRMAAHLAGEIAVMDRGRIIECGTAEQIVRSPQQQRTRELLAATPAVAPGDPAPPVS